MLINEWLLEFRDGVGYTFKTLHEAEISACYFILEKTVEKYGKENENSLQIVEFIKNDQIKETVEFWENKCGEKIIIRNIERDYKSEKLEELKTYTENLFMVEEDEEDVSIKSKIINAKNIMLKSTNPKSIKENTQIINWLEDLMSLKETCDELSNVLDNNTGKDLKKLLNNLNGYYE